MGFLLDILRNIRDAVGLLFGTALAVIVVLATGVLASAGTLLGISLITPAEEQWSGSYGSSVNS